MDQAAMISDQSIVLTAPNPSTVVQKPNRSLTEDVSREVLEAFLEPIRPSEDEPVIDTGAEHGSDAGTEEIDPDLEIEEDDQDPDQDRNRNHNHNSEEDQDSESASESGDEKEDAPGQDGAVRKPRRAEIDPATMTEEDRLLLKERVIKQVDFYFGDTHYPKDQFMLKQARADSAGFIDLSVVMAFKKMRRLTQFPAFVATCLVESTVVVVSEDGTKLRRKAPVPRDPEDALTRTLLVERIAADASPESLKKQFSALGPIDQVRILTRTDQLPEDVNKYIMKGYRQRIPAGLYPNARPIALVEYKSIDDATAACKQLNSSDLAWRGAMRISLLYRKPVKKKKTKKLPENAPSTDSRSATASPASPAMPVTVANLRPIVNRDRASSFGGFNRSASDTSPNIRRHPLMNGIGQNLVAGANNGSSRRHQLESTQSRGSLRGLDSMLRPTRSDSPSWRGDGASSPHGLNRRSGVDSPGPLHRQNILRAPKGPDGSMGFGAGRGTPLESKS